MASISKLLEVSAYSVELKWSLMLKLLNIATCLFVGTLVSCVVILEVFHKSYILQMLARLSDDETEVLIELSQVKVLNALGPLCF